MDTVGAVAGPLAAIGLMAAFAGDIRTVLWFAVLPGLVSVALIIFFVREPEGTRRTARLPLSRAGIARLGTPYWRVVAAGTLVSLARFSEAFLILRASERGLSNTLVPLVLVVMSLAYTVTAYPAGRLSDRIPRRIVLAWGIAALIAADTVLALAPGPAAVLAGVALWGVHLGFSQGVLASLVGDLAPAEHVGTAFGLLNVASGAALLVASAVAGGLWDALGPAATFVAGGAAALVALAFMPLLPARRAAVSEPR
jgi:MFS family permease